MKNTLRLIGLFTAILLSLVIIQGVIANEMATKEECEAKVNQAVELIQKEGLEPSLNKFMNKKGPFIWKDSYIFCIGAKSGKSLLTPFQEFLVSP